MTEGSPYSKLIATARPELESAGSPSYVLVGTAGDICQVISLVYSSLKPAVAQYERVVQQAEPGEEVFIVARAVDRERVIWTVMDGRTRSLHRQLEVIERSFADEDRLM